MKRRDFLKSVCMTPVAAGVAGSLLTHAPLASANTQFNDYKALVVVFLDGGNDAMNTFFPVANTTHTQYSTIRGSHDAGLAINNVNLNNTHFNTAAGHFIKNPGVDHPYVDSSQPGDGLSTSAIRSYRKGGYFVDSNGSASGLAINSMMPELAAMYQSGKASLISNIGTLIRPVSKAQLEANNSLEPVFLFAHNHQKRAVYTAQAHILGNTGWAGRIADAWQIDSPIGLNITYADMNRLGIGALTSPLVMPTSGTASFSSAYNTTNVQRGDAFESIFQRFANIASGNGFMDYYAQKQKHAADLSNILITGMENAPDFSTFTAKNTYGKDLFSIPDMENDIGLVIHDDTRDSIFKQLEAAAKMIKVGKDNIGLNRQILYVRLGGFDSHAQQAVGHANNLRSLSIALSDFQKALEEMGLDDQVVTVSLSEFGRTLKNNTNGTDHGWAGHNFMISNAPEFQGGKVLGTVLDDLSLDGPNAYTSKGRLIPTTGIEQLLAPTLDWFGVDNSLMATALPNLVNFRTDPDNAQSAYLQGLFS